MPKEKDFSFDFDNLPSAGTESFVLDVKGQSFDDSIVAVDREALEDRLTDEKYLSELFNYHPKNLRDVDQEMENVHHSTGKLEVHHIREGLGGIGKVPKTLKLAYVRFQACNKQLFNVDLLSLYIHLLVVDLSNNNLRNVEALSSLEFLHTLNLEGNRMSDVKFVSNFEHLQVLNLCGNEMLEADFERNQLIHLNLAKNLLTSARKFSRETFPRLLHLDLHGNNLSSLGGLEMENLERLYLGENSLKNFGEMGSCPNLRVLHARGNKISKLYLPVLEQLEYLNLRNNAIHRFREIRRMRKIEKLETIVLMGNPVEKHDDYRFQVLSHLNHAPKLVRLDKGKIGNLEKVNASYSIHAWDTNSNSVVSLEEEGEHD